MSCTRTVGASTILSKQSAASVLKALNGRTITSTPRPAFACQHLQPRCFSTSRPAMIKEFFPVCWSDDPAPEGRMC